MLVLMAEMARVTVRRLPTPLSPFWVLLFPLEICHSFAFPGRQSRGQKEVALVGDTTHWPDVLAHLA